MAHKNNIAHKTTKMDGTALLRALLSYEDYWRLMLLLLVVGLLSGLIVYVYARPTYTSTSLIRVNQYVDTSQVAQGGPRDFMYLRSLADQLSSDPMILDAAKSLGVANENTSYNDLRESLIPSVRIDPLDQAHLELRVICYDPKLVRELPQALTDIFEANKAKLRNEFRDKAIKRYMSEIAIVRGKVSEQLDTRLKFEEDSSLASAQIELERLSNVPVDIVRLRYRKEEMERIRGILDKQKSALGVIGQLSLLTNLPKVKEADDRLRAGSIVRQASNTTPFTFQSPTTSKALTQVVVNPEMVEGIEPWRELEKRKRSIEEKMRLLKAKFLEDHPEVIKLKEELREVTSGLDLELEVAITAFDLEYSRTVEKLAELEAKLPEYHKATKSFDDKKMGYDLMKKGQLAWDQAYEQLSRQIESLQFGNDAGSINLEFRGFVNIRSEVPVSPSKFQLAMIGSLLGIGLAGGVPFLLSRLNTSVSNLNDFSDILGITGIGIVPLTDPKILEQINRSPTVGSTTPNALLENFRLIRSGILLNKGPKGNAHVIMITSARPSEGKTTVAANIGWAFSSLGDRTVIIDCDLRRGRVHQAAGCSNHPGLTALLTGKASLKDCLQKSEADNLWILPRGPVIAGTTELLNSQVFSNVLTELKRDYDRIILDTPPVLGLSETAFLQNHADGVVLVVKANATPRKDAEDAFSSLLRLGAHFFGLVLNGVDFSKKANHFNYYYYSDSYYETNWEEQEPADTKKS
jgi:capsular exopolysaccharide synthesis family protein